MFTYVYYVCFMHFLSSISQSCFHKNNYISFTFMNIGLKFVCVFTYVISSDDLTKEGPSARKIEGHFFWFKIFFAPPQKKSSLCGVTLIVLL